MITRVSVQIVLLSLGLLGTLMPGCAGSRDTIVGRGYEIDDVEMQGVERFSRSKVLNHLYMGETSWVPLTPDYFHDDALIEVDARRLEDLYRSYGYYDARVLAIELKPDDEDEEVDILIRVEEGAPTEVVTLDMVWPQDTDMPRDDRDEVQEKATIEEGGRFELARLNASIGNMRMAMLQRGHPLARVSAGADVDTRAHTATVKFDLDPGPAATIGRIRFEGLVEVPDYLVQNEVEFVVGQPYSPARVLQMERAVKSMRVFRWVSTLPPTVVENGEVELVVRVSEADPQSIAIGVQIAVETTRWQEQVRVNYTHTNLFGHLTRLDLSALAGWAELPNPWDPEIHGPVGEAKAKFTKKGLLEKHLLWSLTPRIEVDVQEGYQYYSPSNRFNVSRWFDGWFLASLSQTIRMVDFFNISPDFDVNSSLLKRDFRDPYLLSDVELSAGIFLVDAITKPRDGVILETRYAIASEFVGSDFDFHKLTAKIRGYWNPFYWLQFAVRFQTGLIIPMGSNPGAPFNRRFYLGGANSVRGWGSRKLSPRLEECDEEGDCSSVPIGGYTMVQGNLELRFLVFHPVYLVGFVDMGDVQADELTYNPDEWNFSAGPGLRVDTPMGMIRLDAGFRLNDTGVYDEPDWGIYFGFGEAF